MEIVQSFHVPYPTAQVWESFQDIEGIVACLPGAALLESTTSDALKISMTVKLGPIVATFSGDGAMTLDGNTLTGNIAGSGADRKSGSRVKGEARFSLHSETAGAGTACTRVDVQVNFSITGSLAQFSRGGIIKELAQRLTQAFSENLRLKLERSNIEVCEVSVGFVQAVQTATPSTRHPEKTTVTKPLDLGNIFWHALWARLRQIFHSSRP